MFRATRLSAGFALGFIVPGVAGAAVYSSGLTMYESPDVTTYATPVAGGTLDIDNPTDYVWPVDTLNGFHNSGFLREIVDANGDVIGGVLDRTTLVSQVYRVTTPTVIPNVSGNLSLDPGDMVFTYTIRLTSESQNTVDTLAEFGVSGIGPSLGGFGAFLPRQILGRGLSVAGLSGATSNYPIDHAGDFTYDDLSIDETFGISNIDWEWQNNPALQLDNAEEITLMIFTKPALFDIGYAKFLGNPGAQSSTADPLANSVPVLIPVVPAPGPVGLAVVIGAMGARRRRLGHRFG